MEKKPKTYRNLDISRKWMRCPYCDGEGRHGDGEDEEVCQYCKGKGWLSMSGINGNGREDYDLD